jgi:hypothetical protein
MFRPELTLLYVCQNHWSEISLPKSSSARGGSQHGERNFLDNDVEKSRLVSRQDRIERRILHS